MDNIEIIKTQDGSVGLYNKELNEVYHSCYGAKTEAMEKFIEPCLMLDKKPLKILDICYGIGYNTKCALNTFKEIDFIDCVDIDRELVFKSFEFDFNPEINQIIKDNLHTNGFIRFYIDDIRKVINKLNKKYDIIFHDGFAPHKQCELWSFELIRQIISKLDKDGIYCTYNHSKPVLKALVENGILVGKTIKNNKTIGTVASFNKNLVQNPLSEIELNELNTKSAIPYHDYNLSLSREEILALRKKETEISKLPSLSSIKSKNKLSRVF